MVLDAMRERYVTSDAHVDATDGLSVDFADWRFNVRASNTEPLLRLNVESRADAALGSMIAIRRTAGSMRLSVLASAVNKGFCSGFSRSPSAALVKAR